MMGNQSRLDALLNSLFVRTTVYQVNLSAKSNEENVVKYLGFGPCMH